MCKKIFTIILNYNGYIDTLECVKSVKKSNYDNITTVVIDNASTDDSYYHLEKELGNEVVLLKTEKNLGYAGGNNIGIQYALDNNADYICVLNNDTLVEEDSIYNCMRELEEDETIGFLGPTVMEYDKDVIQSTGGDIAIQKGVVTLNNHGKKIQDVELAMSCDYIGGACIMCRSSLIKEIGLIPENYFLFFEETEWCYIAKQKGYHNICVSNSKIKHKGSASIDVVGGLHEYLMERNRVVFVKRNSGSKALYCKYLIFQLVKDIYYAICRDKKYWQFIRYHMDGVMDKIDYKKYPFIVIKDN